MSTQEENDVNLVAFCVERNTQPPRNKYTVEGVVASYLNQVLMERSGSSRHKPKCTHDTVDAWALSKLKILICERAAFNVTWNLLETNKRCQDEFLTNK